MPNWCDNGLSITGETEEVHKCIQFIAGKAGGENANLDFDKIVPTPPELYESEKAFYGKGDKQEALEKKHKEMQAKYGYPTAYDFHCSEWGTKWNACDPHLSYEKGDTTAQIGFQTAWSPPIPVIAKLGEKFPHLHFELKYIEMGCCFAGIFTVLIEDDYISDVCVSDDINDTTFKDIAYEFGYGEWIEEINEQIMEDEIEANEAKEQEATVAKFAQAMEEATQKPKEPEQPKIPKPSKKDIEQYREEYGGLVI